MKRDKGGFRLSSGRHIYAHNGIVGLSPDGDTIYEGYDGWIELVREDGSVCVEGQDEGLTPSEHREIADFMIALWTKWAS